MTTSERGTGIVGDNVQAAVDTYRHLIAAHEVTSAGLDLYQLTAMASQVQQETGQNALPDAASFGHRTVCLLRHIPDQKQTLIGYARI